MGIGTLSQAIQGFASIEEELQAIRDQNLYRRLKTLDRIQGPYAWLGEKKTLLFCGNDYLGLSQHPEVIERVRKVALREGVGAGAARLISGTSVYHSELEKQIAVFRKKKRALIYSTGYLTNLGVLSALSDENDLIVMDKLCHASIIDGARLSGATVRVFPHKNYSRCQEILERSESFRRKIIVSDSVFSMDGDLADLAQLTKLKEKYGCLLVVDDAHGTGVLGTEGRGATEDANLEDKIDIIVGTFSKAFGCLGGYVAASDSIIDYLINKSRPFIFATALPPMVCAGVLKSLEVIQNEPEIRHRLWRNIQMMHEALRDNHFMDGPIQSPIFPVVIGPEKEAVRISEALLERGILVPAVRYPTVGKGKARLRVTVSALHEESDIQLFASELNRLKV